VQFLASNLHGPWLVDVAGGLVSLVALALFLRVWQPRQNWHFADEPPPAAAVPTYSRRQLVTAWVPWALLTAFVFVWGLPEIKQTFGALSWRPEVPWLHEAIARRAPVVPDREFEKAVYEFHWLAGTGTGIFLAAVASAAWLRVSPGQFVRLFRLTLLRMGWPLCTIACMLALAFTTRYSGMDATLGLAFTKTGWVYPLF